MCRLCDTARLLRESAYLRHHQRDRHIACQTVRRTLTDFDQIFRGRLAEYRQLARLAATFGERGEYREDIAALEADCAAIARALNGM